MTKVARISATGGAAVLRVEDVEVGRPGRGEIRVRQSSAGVNFVDIYHRKGLYPLPGFPAVLGVEGAGVIEAVGESVEDLAVGDRVAWAGLPAGGYAEARLLPAERAIALPASISERTAAAAMLRGMTAHMLIREVAKLNMGDVVLVHAAAGGLGLILTQWAKRLGATVIGTVGSTDKANLACRYGLDHAVQYRDADFVKEVLDLTGGRGVDVAFDGIGGDILLRTLDCVRPLGLVVSMGQVSGSFPGSELSVGGSQKSVSIVRPSVLAHTSDEYDYRRAATALFSEIENGLHVEIGAEFNLDDVAEAHVALESGRTTGSVLLSFQSRD